MNICIRVRIPDTDHWTSSTTHVTPGIREAYAGYKERPNYYRETPYITNSYAVYRPDNDPYLPTYTARVEDIPASTLNDGLISRAVHETMEHDGKAIPIMDMNDVSVFIVDNPAMGRANWMPARSYQAWAYRDFIYDRGRSIKKSYMSRGTFRILYEGAANQSVTTIDVANIEPNIVFNISRNDNNSVYFERNDEFRTRVRICDNESARAGYLGFYTRLTMDPGIIVISPAAHAQQFVVGGGGGPAGAVLSVAHLPNPEETDDEEHQCILCFKYRINARFLPCDHQVCCSVCYSKMAKNACPVCRADITRIINAVTPTPPPPPPIINN
jgi:hypothetical protein